MRNAWGSGEAEREPPLHAPAAEGGGYLTK